MKKILLLIAGLILLTYVPHELRARDIPDASGNFFNKTTNPPTNDLWQAGGRYVNGKVVSATEIVLDYTGSLYPTSTLGTQNLGSSSFPWNTEYIVNSVSSGYTELAIKTTAQLVLRSDPVGSIFLVNEKNQTTGANIANAYNECVSTAAAVASYVYIAVSTNTAGSTPAVAGAACAE